jgi:ParB-like chromosome segregation protein Spo0J
MQVELRPIGSIKPYENNPRQNDAAVEAVAASILEFGFRQPIVVDEGGVIIVGHTRYKAALKLGLEEVPVHVAVGLTPAQAKAYRIADNQAAAMSAWDDDKLPLELSQLQQLDFDLNLTGFSADELMRLLGSGENEGLTDPDAVPEPPDEPITQPGDLWLLGRHRLLCGDSSMPEDVDRLLDVAPIHLVNSDPPYGVRVEPRSTSAIRAGLSSFEATPHQKLDVERHSEKGQPTTKKRRAPGTARWPTTSSVRSSSTGCYTPGSVTSPVYCCRAGRSICGVVTAIAATIRPPFKPPGCTSPRRSSGTNSIPC